MKDEQRCPHCGQSMDYYSTMNSGICQTLIIIAKAIKEKGSNVINIRHEILDKGKMVVTNYTNITHLNRLGLIAKVRDENGKMQGNYCLTRRAMDFFKGASIPKWVRVEKRTEDHGSRTVESGDELVTINDFKGLAVDWSGIGYEVREGRVIETV